MANLNLALINRPAAYPGQPVPKEMDLHMIKYITGLRKEAVRLNPNLITMEPNDHSDVFYDARTHLNKLGYDTSVYNDNVTGGSDRRKDFYDNIKGVCENYHGVKRHQIGIFPEDRAVMAYDGRYYSVGFESLRNLMPLGTDVIVVEKQGTVLKMVPYTQDVGLAFIQSQGFVSEYGSALARLSIKDYQTANDFTDLSGPVYPAHLGDLTDCDVSGVLIGMKIPGATRIGLDPNSIAEIIEYNKRLGIDLTSELRMKNLVETTKLNTHWQGLKGVLDGNKKSKPYQDLLRYMHDIRYPYGPDAYLREWRNYLRQPVYDSDGNRMQFIDWLKTNRIELNTVLAIIKPAAFWNWLKFKLLEVWPDRNYNRVFDKPEPNDVYTTKVKNFMTWLDNTFKPLIDTRYKPIEKQLNNINGFIKDTDGTEKMIQNRMSKQIATDAKIKLIGERLEVLANELNLEPLD